MSKNGGFYKHVCQTNRRKVVQILAKFWLMSVIVVFFFSVAALNPDCRVAVNVIVSQNLKNYKATPECRS